jgi:excisionase family DNA binding protein
MKINITRPMENLSTCPSVPPPRHPDGSHEKDTTTGAALADLPRPVPRPTRAQPNAPSIPWPSASPDLEVLTAEEAAAILRVNVKTVYGLIREQALPGVIRLGRSVRISRASLVSWIASGQTRVARKR